MGGGSEPEAPQMKKGAKLGRKRLRGPPGEEWVPPLPPPLVVGKRKRRGVGWLPPPPWVWEGGEGRFNTDFGPACTELGSAGVICVGFVSISIAQFRTD